MRVSPATSMSESALQLLNQFYLLFRDLNNDVEFFLYLQKMHDKRSGRAPV